jgi:4-amino-4-deoxy-L-arabinose transferase-like glycosyltransferase
MRTKKKQFKKYISFYLIALIFILLLGIVLRFINTPDRYAFDDDGIRDAIVAYEGAKSFSFPLAGPFSSTGPYTFGPWYYISLILFSIILPVPYAPWILMGIMSVLTILLMADIGRLLRSKTLGLILATITAIAPTQIDIATGLSNINPVPFFATLSIWITFKLIKREAAHYLWYLFLGIALGMGINTHHQMAGLLWLPLLLWIVMGWRKFYIPLLIALGGFVTFIPLLVFNLLTNWHTLNGIKEMYIAKERTYVPNSWKIYLIQFWPSYLKSLLFSPFFINVALVLVFATAFLKDFVTKRYSPGLIMLGIVFLLNFLGLRYYWGERHDVYLTYLSPILFIFFGYALASLWETKYGKLLVIVFALIVGWNMLLTDYTRIKGSDKAESITWRKEVQILQNKYPNHNIVLYDCTPFYQNNKRTLIYFLAFAHQPQAEEKKLAMKGNDCLYPSTKEFNFKKSKIVDKYAKDVYPFILPEVKEAHFNFIDISMATPSAIKEAKWEPVTTRDMFNSTVNWWK